MQKVCFYLRLINLVLIFGFTNSISFANDFRCSRIEVSNLNISNFSIDTDLDGVSDSIQTSYHGDLSFASLQDILNFTNSFPNVFEVFGNLNFLDSPDGALVETYPLLQLSQIHGRLTLSGSQHMLNGFDQLQYVQQLYVFGLGDIALIESVGGYFPNLQKSRKIILDGTGIVSNSFNNLNECDTIGINSFGEMPDEGVFAHYQSTPLQSNQGYEFDSMMQNCFTSLDSLKVFSAANITIIQSLGNIEDCSQIYLNNAKLQAGSLANTQLENLWTRGDCEIAQLIDGIRNARLIEIEAVQPEYVLNELDSVQYLLFNVLTNHTHVQLRRLRSANAFWLDAIECCGVFGSTIREQSPSANFELNNINSINNFYIRNLEIDLFDTPFCYTLNQVFIADSTLINPNVKLHNPLIEDLTIIGYKGFSLNFLEEVKVINSFTAAYSPHLSECSIFALCNLSETSLNSINIIGNANGCSSIDEVLLSCSGIYPGPQLGSSCDDYNPCTVDDVLISECVCQGMIVTQAIELNVSITEGETYYFNGQSLNSAGTYESVLVNAAGCDSVVTLTLSVNPALSCEITASATSICSNALACASNQLPASLQNGLIAYYPFCGNAQDASGNGNDGLVNGAQLSTDRFGNAVSAYYFNGVNSKIDLSSINESGDFSISYWEKINEVKFSYPIGLGVNTTNFYNGYGIGQSGYTGECAIPANIHFVFDGLTECTNLMYSSAESVSQEWRLVSFTYEQGNSKLYYNGNLVSESTELDYPGFFMLTLGIRSDSAFPFDGWIDDVIIHNRALGVSEIQSLLTDSGVELEIALAENTMPSSACTSSQLPTNLQDGLIAYYPFCGNANDASGNGNDGQVSGAFLSSDRFGSPASAYYFNGVNSRIDLSNINETGDFSITYWEKINQVKFAYPVGLGVNTTNFYNGYGIGQSGYTGECAIPANIHFVFDGLTECTNLTFASVQSVAQQWRLVSFTHEQGNSKLYYNGNLVSESSELDYPGFFLLTLGVRSDSAFPFDGWIDDVLVHNRALSAAEIQSLNGGPIAQVLWSNGATTPSITVSPTETTTFSVTVTQNGQTCTSDVTITVNQPSAEAIEATITEGETYDFNGQSLAAAGTYESVLENAAGCDSVVTLTLTVNPAFSCEITASATSICAGESIELSVDGAAANISACASNQLSANLQNGLVAYYPFCGNANDASGNGNDGFAFGVDQTADRFGRADNAYNFNEGDYIEINNTSGLYQGIGTFGFWINTSSNKINMELLKKGNFDSTSSGEEVSFALNTPNSGMCVKYNSNCIPGFNWYDAASATNLRNGVWHLIVGVIKPFQTEYYIDGVLMSTINVPNELSDICGGNINIGRNWISDTDYYEGKFDDLFIWNRPLSPSEISQLYVDQSVLWSNGATTPSITVAPTETTTYSVTVTEGNQTCTSEVTITVLPTETFYADIDGDGFGDAGNSINACDGQPQGYVTDNTDCDDTNAAVFIGASCDDGDVCTQGDVVRGDCTCGGTYADDDQDGTCNALDLCAFGPEPGTACDDNNPCTFNDSVQDDCTCVGQLSEPETSLESAHACEPYEWNGQIYTESGTYTYSATNALGCDSIATLELTVGAPSSSTTTINACNSFTWNGQAYTQSGTFSFVTPNASGCDSTATLVLTIQNPSVAPTAINASAPSVTVGGSVTLSVVGGNLGTGAQWKWYSQSCGGQFIGTGNSLTVTVNATTTYFVRAEGDCNVTGCASVTITANAIPCGPQSAAASALSVCYGSSTTLTVSGQLNAGASWKWYKNACGSGVVVGTGPSLAVLPTATTTYFVRAEGGTCGITSCQSITITVNPAPAQPAFIQGPVNGLCGLQGVGYSTPAVSGASSYVWSLPTGATIVSGQGTNAIVVNFGSSLGINTVCGATSICVRSVSVCGSSALRCVNLSVAPATPGAITGQSIVCRTQSYTYSIAAVAGATSYTWTVPSTWQITSGQGTTSITVVAGTMNGEVRVLANNACGSSKIGRRSVTTFVCSNPGMTMLDEMPELALWPNPAQEVVHLDVDQIIPDKMEIYDMLGKRMYEGAWEREFDVTSWPSGIYFVRVSLGEDQLIKRLEIAH